MKERINDYLASGGLFNPELMEHEKVRDLLMDCRIYIEFLEKRLTHSTEMHEHAMKMVARLMGVSHHTDKGYETDTLDSPEFLEAQRKRNGL